MAKISSKEKSRREKLDADVKELMSKGYSDHEISVLLNIHINAVRASVRRLNGTDGRWTPPYDPAKEAEMLIAAKMAPVVKPKAKLTRVDGWENGKYVHYEAYDVSEFWGL